MSRVQAVLKINESTPLLFRRMKEIPDSPAMTTATHNRPDPVATHFSVVTTPGFQPEMHDQQED